MARVTGQRIRQMIWEPGPAPIGGVVLDRLELYNEDGSPADLSPGADGLNGEPGPPGLMAWGGQWDVDTEYPMSYIVRHDGALWVSQADVPAGEDPPEVGTPPEDVIDLPAASALSGAASGWADTQAHRLTDQVFATRTATIDLGSASGQGRVFYFDLLTGGDITFDELQEGTENDIMFKLYDSVGAVYGGLDSGNSEGGGIYTQPWLIEDLPAGRYFFFALESNVPVTLTELRPAATPSEGAVFDLGPNWDLMLDPTA